MPYHQVAFFDFDHTLTRNGSLPIFLRTLLGRPRFWWAAIHAAGKSCWQWPALLSHPFKPRSSRHQPMFFTERADSIRQGHLSSHATATGVRKRDRFKDSFRSHLYRKALHNVPMIAVEHRLTQLEPRIRWNYATLERLYRHYQANHLIVIATASPAIYIQKLLENIPHHYLLATQLGHENATLTGELDVVCVGQEKARYVQEFLNQHGPFQESWAYGNSPDDLPMLALVNHPIVVKRGKLLYRLKDKSGYIKNHNINAPS